MNIAPATTAILPDCMDALAVAPIPSRAAMIASLKVGDVVTAVISRPISTSIEPECGLFSELSELVGG
jgi:hypothetical protein